jgi:maltooligosyltrehalose trehalohydrolase
LHTVITGERSGYYADFGRLSDLATALEQPFVYAGRHSPFRARSHGRTPTEISGHKFLAYLQNHDQIGNRARGERLSQLTNPNRLKIGAALVLLSPYVPMVFQGEEWAASTPFLFIVDFTAEPDLAKAVVQGRMREFAAFGWNAADIPDASSRESLLRCQLNWEELSSAVHADMLAWYRSLIQLRRSSPALSSGCLEDTSVTFDEAEQWLRVDRGPMTIACNFANNPRCFCFEHEPAPRLLISSQPLGDPRGSQYILPPESVAVFQRPV